MKQNLVYSTAKSNSMANLAAYNTRLKMYRKLSQKINLEELQTVIDVGATADRAQVSSNFFENLYPHPERITAFSNQDASWMEQEYKGIRFVRGTALDMPFENDSFDLVFSSAVMEHVGNFENQICFVKECLRISKKYVFITTPNRWHPIELHTAIPLLHYLPKNIHRSILKILGKEFFSKEENLNLLTKNDLRRICEGLIEVKNISLQTVSFLGFPSNLLLLLEK
ncbi:hypothetical protein AGMMS49938_14090 [Fibrobacterales bacterium]|nr:hypothetical protein AGMMS49938_14090 [Fibrobacterales bacterium]